MIRTLQYNENDNQFCLQFVIGVPNCDQRKEMLVFQTKKLPLSSDVNLDYLAKQSLGYVSADLTALVRQATINALTTRKGELPEKKLHFKTHKSQSAC